MQQLKRWKFTCKCLMQSDRQKTWDSRELQHRALTCWALCCLVLWCFDEKFTFQGDYGGELFVSAPIKPASFAPIQMDDHWLDRWRSLWLCFQQKIIKMNCALVAISDGTWGFVDFFENFQRTPHLHMINVLLKYKTNRDDAVPQA